MTTIMCFGSFDILHPGHIYFLKRAKGLGDKLVAVVARDSTIQEVKGITPKYNERDRVEHIRDLKIADKVVMGYETDKYEVIEDFNPEINFERIGFMGLGDNFCNFILSLKEID